MRIFILSFLCVVLFFSIKKISNTASLELKDSSLTNLVEEEALEEKTEPYLYFAQQRAYPNQNFDSDAWNTAMQKAQKMAKSSLNAAARGGNSPSAWTLEGPKNVPGRVNALALQPGTSDTILAGFATGGIFRSTNGGVNWAAVFDAAEWSAIGDITFAPSQPNIVYASTGDPQLTGYTINGVGVFKSTDFGKTWAYAGFKNGGVLSTLVVHPTNPDILYVASMGNPFTRDTERGVYKSIDGGKNWTKQLNISNQAGCIDLVINAQNPNILYASFWDRIRSHKESIAWGPNAKVYKTSDAGQTWTQMTNGLPSGNNCRIGLAISQQNPDKVYAIYCDSTFQLGGLYRTVDGGQTWVSQSISGANNAYVGFGWYFGKLRLDPNNDNDIYLPGIVLYRKTPTGNSFAVEAGAHADIHELVVAPNGKRYLGSDGGPYYQEVGGSASWELSQDLPTTQFYKLGQNPNQPTWYYGGAQDNGTRGGPGNSNVRWEIYFSKDGFDCHFHPTLPNTFWMSSQNGEISLTNDGGFTWVYGSSCLGSGDRCAWNTPFILSPHDPQRLYAGTNRVHTTFGLQSLTWGAISPDLTDGNIYGNAFHVITCLDESLLKVEKVFAGTSDGNVWYRAANGNWVNRTAGLPDLWVTAVKGSPSNVDRIFVGQSGLRANETLAHIHRSDDNGATWIDISGDLPDLPVNDLHILAGHADSIILAATDIGVYFTRNGGQNWARLGNNLPFVPVYELEYNLSQKEIAAATFGRSIWSFPKDSILTHPIVPPAPDPIYYTISGFLGDSLASNAPTAPVAMGDSLFYFGKKFVFKQVLEGSNLTLKPSKNDDALNGVNTFDLLLLQKHLLGVLPITNSFKLIAADANNSGTLTPSDIIELRRLILGYYLVGLPNVNSWRFIPKSFVFTNPLNPFLDTFPEQIVIQNIQAHATRQDFNLIKIGDLDSTAIRNFGGNLAETRHKEERILEIEDAFVEKNAVHTFYIKADLNEVVASQFDLHFEPSAFELLSVTPIATSLHSEDFYLDKKTNSLRVALISSGDKEEVLFAVKLKAKKSGLLSTSIFIAENTILAAQAFKESGEKMAIRLTFSPKNIETSALAFAPNPFLEKTSLALPKDFKGGTLELFDVQGRRVHTQFCPPLSTSMSLERSVIGQTSGVYFWRLGNYSGRIVATKR